MRKNFCFDLDGTITAEEILPLLAAELDLYDEISVLTEATINGIIPFEKSFKLRCQLLSNLSTNKIQEVVKKVKLNNEIVRFIKNNKDECYIITGNIYEWIKPIIEKLDCKVFCSKGKFIDNKMISLEKILNKGDAINELRTKGGTIVSIGDGMGDVSMFEKSDISIAFGGVHKPIKSLIHVSDYIVYEENSLCRLLNTL